MSQLRHKLMQRINRMYIQYVIRPKSFDELYNREVNSNFSYTRSKAKSKLGYDIDLNAPRSFNEKSIHSRLNSRRDIWPVVTDKVEVRTWLAENGLLERLNLIPVQKIFSDPSDLDKTDLNTPSILKAAWASGYNIFMNNDKNSDYLGIVKTLEKWASESYHPERLIWAAEKIPRRFIIEDLLKGEDGRGLVDYKFFVFNGSVELIQLISDRQDGARYAHFSRDKNRLSVKRVGKAESKISLPDRIDELISVAEEIGAFFDFARVDLYFSDGKIYFGEITQTPANGFAAFDPVEYDFELGEKWNYNAHN